MTWRVLGDWGTSHLRLYRVEDGHVTARREGPGIGALTGTAEQALHAGLAPWLADGPPASITLCGMAGARSGLQEVPYLDCPMDADRWARAAATLMLADVPLRMAPGLACSDDTFGPNVMRGEETQIFGALALEPALSSGSVRLVLPGTHSKWVRLEQGKVRDFLTCLSGELFALLRDRSILLALGPPETPADEPEGFADGLDRVASGAGLVSRLFETRAQQLRGGRSASWALGFLSGLVIGNEIADQRSAAGLPDDLILIGAPALTARYQTALHRFGVAAREMDGEACALRGLELLDGNR